MEIVIDREKRITLLRWLKQGYIDTLDLPEAYKGGVLFMELLQASGIDEESADTEQTAGKKRQNSGRSPR